MSTDELSGDQSGVEILSAEQIESRAAEVLREYDPELVRNRSAVPIEEMLFELAADGRLEFDPRAHIPGLFGRCRFRPPAIEISGTLKGPKRRFVAAHEFAHYVLHSKRAIRAGDYHEDSDLTIFGGNVPPARKWMEWQANRFASAFLMPYGTINEVLQEALEETRRLFGDARDIEMSRYVGASYDVSPAAARIRIEEIKKLAKTWTS